MRRLLVTCLLLCMSGVHAQQGVVTYPDTNITTTNASSTITATGTFQQVFAAPALTTTQQIARRSGCVIENNGTHNMNVFFGPIANATTANSLVIAAGAQANCAQGAGIVLQDQVSITGTAGDAFYAVQQ